MERVSNHGLVPQKDAFHPMPRSQGEGRCCAGHPLSEHSGTVGWGQELTWLLHKVSFMSTHVTWPAATPPPAAILSALPGKAGLGRVSWGLGRAAEENPGCCPAPGTFLPVVPVPWAASPLGAPACRGQTRERVFVTVVEVFDPMDRSVRKSSNGAKSCSY